MAPRRPSVEPFVMRLYPERKSRLFCLVRVWPTHAAMCAHLNATHRALDGKGFGRKTAGACSRHIVTSYKTGTARKSPCFAQINLHRGKLGMEIITHEIFHATMAWAHRVGFDFAKVTKIGVTRSEERITYAHSNMCRDFMNRGMRPGGIYTDRDLVVATKQ